MPPRHWMPYRRVLTVSIYLNGILYPIRHGRRRRRLQTSETIGKIRVGTQFYLRRRRFDSSDFIEFRFGADDDGKKGRRNTLNTFHLLFCFHSKHFIWINKIKKNGGKRRIEPSGSKPNFSEWFVCGTSGAPAHSHLPTIRFWLQFTRNSINHCYCVKAYLYRILLIRCHFVDGGWTNCCRIDDEQSEHDTMSTHRTSWHYYVYKLVLLWCRIAIVKLRHTFKYCKSWCSALISSAGSVTFENRFSITSHIAIGTSATKNKPPTNCTPLRSFTRPFQYVVFYN